jgi:hypothetical protein
MVGPTRDYLEALYEKRPATRSLKEWSIYRGHVLSKTSYIEGLDLLRQDMTIENAKAFIDVVLDELPSSQGGFVRGRMADEERRKCVQADPRQVGGRTGRHALPLAPRPGRRNGRRSSSSGRRHR